MKFEEYLAKQKDDPEYVAAEKDLKPLLDIANDVLALRLEKEWSQSELARRMGTQQSNISRIENGLANPTIEFLQRLAKALDTDLIIRLKTEEIVERTRSVQAHKVKQIDRERHTVESQPLAYHARDVHA